VPSVLRRGPGVRTNSTERAEQQQIAFTRVAQRRSTHRRPLTLHADVSLRPNLYMQGLLSFQQSIQEKSAFFAAAGDACMSAGTFATSRMWPLRR
jgi:hypothetical protein